MLYGAYPPLQLFVVLNSFILASDWLTAVHGWAVSAMLTTTGHTLRFSTSLKTLMQVVFLKLDNL